MFDFKETASHGLAWVLCLLTIASPTKTAHDGKREPGALIRREWMLETQATNAHGQDVGFLPRIHW